MTPYSNTAQTAYAQPVASGRLSRETEYNIIARVTQMLIAAQATHSENKPRFIEALLRNERLWSTLASDVANQDNSLPDVLRARLFYLYRFTVEHSSKVRKGTASAEVLIDINKAVLRGLRGDGARV